jgi:hypothetical protein
VRLFRVAELFSYDFQTILHFADVGFTSEEVVGHVFGGVRNRTYQCLRFKPKLLTGYQDSFLALHRVFEAKQVLMLTSSETSIVYKA